MTLAPARKPCRTPRLRLLPSLTRSVEAWNPPRHAQRNRRRTAPQRTQCHRGPSRTGDLDLDSARSATRRVGTGVETGARVAAGQGVAAGTHAGPGRCGKPLGDASWRIEQDGHHRRTSGLRAERRLAGRHPRCAGRVGSASPIRTGLEAARDASAGRLGRRRRRAFWAQPSGLIGRRRPARR